MRIGIVGFGREGKMALEYWGNQAEEVSVYDQNESLEIPAQCTKRLGSNWKELLLADSPTLDLIVRSPGVPLWDIQETIQGKVTTLAKEFFDLCPCPIIGVTGTKGKGTTATLIYEILKADGKDIHLVGNIGTPSLSILPKLTPQSIVVYELSSFQLFDLHKSPQTAVCLLVTEDHLDWHKDIQQYQASKGNIFKYQKEEDTAIWFQDNVVSRQLASLSIAKNRIPYGENALVQVNEKGFFVYNNEEICAVHDALLPGKHNEQNICAAIAATWGLVDKKSIVQAIKTFKGLPFHIETIATHNGITFVNDSFATNPTATAVAIKSMTAPTTLLIGGVDRGLHLEPFVESIQKSSLIKEVVVYGTERERIAKLLSLHNIPHVVIDGNFEEVFRTAIEKTKSGEIVLFSPGAPSFDMFKDYQDRGHTFNALVAKYAQGLL